MSFALCTWEVDVETHNMECILARRYTANEHVIPIPSGGGVWVNSLKISKNIVCTIYIYKLLYPIWFDIHIGSVDANWSPWTCDSTSPWATRAKSASAVKCKYTRPAAFLQSPVVIRGKFVGIFVGGWSGGMFNLKLQWCKDVRL